MKFENIYSKTKKKAELAMLSMWGHSASREMRCALEDLFKRESLLAEPVFQSSFGWTPAQGDEWRKYLNSEVVAKTNAFANYPPYAHQAESFKILSDKVCRSVAVTTGTGSGKTECFLYPILSDIYSRKDEPSAVEAIFLYPLNALMKDQKRRIGSLCESLGITFASYNGETPETGGTPAEYARHTELTSRYAIRHQIPRILLANPSILEYILVRKADMDL